MWTQYSSLAEWFSFYQCYQLEAAGSSRESVGLVHLKDTLSGSWILSLSPVGVAGTGNTLYPVLGTRGPGFTQLLIMTPVVPALRTRTKAQGN